jgi:hypothetical protein
MNPTKTLLIFDIEAMEDLRKLNLIEHLEGKGYTADEIKHLRRIEQW